MRAFVVVCAVLLLLVPACGRKKQPEGQVPAQASGDVNTGLYSAASAGNAAEVIRMLKSGAAPDSQDPSHDASNPDYGPRRAIEAAVIANSFDSVKALFDAGAAMPAGSEAVHDLLQKDSPDIRIVKMLGDRKWDFTRADLGGDVPLGLAVRNGHTDIVRYLLGRGIVYSEPGKGAISSEDTIALTARNADEKKREKSALEFSGIFESARTGFEGDGFYITLLSQEKKAMEFRFDSMPEIPFFAAGSAEMNRDFKGKEFVVRYIVGSETDVRGKAVKVNRVRTCVEVK